VSQDQATPQYRSTIRWSDIEAECGDYRSGFIAVFKKYEGQSTDERDAQGRTVKVTAASFAPLTFRALATEANLSGWREELPRLRTST